MAKKRDREGRHQNALDRLGTEHPRCRTCLESDPRCLERHHLAGEAFGDDQVIECRNCHRKLSDDQCDHPDAINPNAPDFSEQLAHFLLGLGDFLALLAERLKEFGKRLLEQISPNAENMGVNHE